MPQMGYVTGVFFMGEYLQLSKPGSLDRMPGDES
jgi:hypothetical protein